MKKTLLLVLFVVAGINAGFCQIAAWNNNALTGVTYGSISATTLNPNLETAVLSRGDGVVATSLGGGYASSGWVDADLAGAIANKRYYQATLISKNGYSISLSTLDAKLRRTSTGPNTYIWRYSLDGINFNSIGSGNTFTTTTTGGDVQPQMSLSGIPDLQNLPPGSTVTFRLYAWGASGSGGTLAIGTGNVNSLSFGGTVTAVTTSSKSVSITADTDAAEPSTSGTFNINLSDPAPTGGVNVTYSLTGTAILDEDYSDPANGEITIPEGSSSGIVTLPVINGDNYKETKTIIITLNNATNGYVISSSSSATINRVDKDPKPLPTIPYSQVFNIPHTSTEYPESWNGWVVATSPGSNYNTASSSTARALIASSTASTTSGNVHNYDNKIGFLNTGSIDLAIGFTFSASGKSNVQVSYDVMTIRNPYGTGTATATNNRINEITLQYRVGTSGNFTTLTGVDYQNNTETQTSGTTPQNLQARRITLPSACNNQPVIEIRWISRQVSGGGSRPSLAIDNVTIDENTDPPTITSLSPANEATNVSTNGTAIMVFNVSVQRGEGNILIKKRSDNTVVSTINVYSNAITVSGQNVFIDLTGLPATTELYIEVETGAFKDLFNTDFTGISGNSTWTFTTGTLLYNLNFQNCTSALSDGFTQYSETGSVVWGCTTFGRNSVDPSGSSASGVQINGFINSANQPNVDWLISPSLDLTGTNYPLLSFWSRTAFTGQMLQLKVSTDYVSGDPRLATWTDLNGKFPSQASNIWTLSENINLSDYKEANVHIAFIYTSTADDGARWTIDDIAITNSATPPPPTITTSASDVVFNYVAVGSHADKTFTFTGNDLTEGVTLTAGGVFQLSKDGESFSSTIEYTQEEANNNLTTVYVRFAPGQADQNFSGLIDISTSGVSASINLRGTSIDPATTLEVVNWNVEWFGHTGNGPTDEERQEQNVKTILTNVNADIYALSEVVDESRLANVVSQMPGFAYVISNFSSHTNTSRNPESALATAQKLAFVYKTDVFSNISTTALLSQGINSAADITNPAYYYWSSGRFPYMLSADVTLNGVTKPMKFVLVHAKANTNPTDESYNRRKKGADTLHYTLNQLYPNDQIIILGDFNDDLDYSITSGFTTTSWDNFTTDDDNFYEPTLPLSLAGKKSTVSYNDMIDHVVISNETKPYYMSSTASVLSDVTSMVSNYGSTTSDHYPVFTRYMFCKLTPPADITVSNDAGQCGAIVNFNVGSTMTCGTVTTVPASGSFFPLGETTVTVSATTGETATFKVTVNDAQNPSITAPNAVSVNADAGQCSASNANVNLGSPVYGDNCSNATVTNNAPTVFPVGNTIVTWTVTDASGNTATATQSVTVTDNQVPIITTCPAVPVQCYNPAGTYSIPMIAANDNCETITHSYVISGATSRSGNTANASGTFIVGTSIITWAVTDAHNNTSTCQTTVVINSPVITSVPDVYAVTPGGAANTIYIGYGPSSVTLNGSVSGGTAPYSYKWTVGSSAGPALNNTVSYSVTPATNTSYYFNVKDVYGCSAPLVIKTVNVVDVRCGPKLDKVTICQTVKGKRTTSCVSEKDVAGLLANGATLGSCSGASITNNTAAQVIEKVVPNTLTITAMPNPSRSQFSLFISGSSKEAISMIVVDGVGRNVEVRNNIKAGEHVQIGSSYKAGIYIVEIIQGDSRKQIKLVKLPG